MYSDFLSTVKTVRDREILLDEARAVKDSLYEPNKGGVENSLKKDVRALSAVFFRNAIENNPDYEAYLEGLISTLLAMEEFKVVFSVEPSESLVESVYNYMLKNTGMNVLLDYYIDPGIIGGVLISYKGKYYDGSLSKTLETYINLQK